jgi:DNA-binding NarL/FixJ family response regulator
MMDDENFTTGIELALRSPIDDNVTYVPNDDSHSVTRLPACDGLIDKNSLEVGKNGGFIALIESSVFLRECIHHSLQPAIQLPIVPYSSMFELQQQPRSSDPRLVVLSSLEAGKEVSSYTLKMLAELFPGIPVVVLGYKNDPELARTAICHGAKGYLPFCMEFAIAVEAVRFVLAGGTYVPVECFDYPRAGATPPAALGKVTDRELAVVRAIQQGKSN